MPLDERNNRPSYYHHEPSMKETPTWATIEVGRRFRRGRHQARMSQRAVAARAGVAQSEVSRLERGKTPGMSAYRFMAMALALGPRFPFGTCPHDHNCAYGVNPWTNEMLESGSLIEKSRILGNFPPADIPTIEAPRAPDQT